MDGSGAILSHISSLKDMLDQIDEEIEANFQTTREIESEIARCVEIEAALAAKESELTKILFTSQFEMIGLLSDKDIDRDGNDELMTLLSEKEFLENELYPLNDKISTLKNSMLAFAGEILADLDKSNCALHLEIQSVNQENEKVLKDIGNLKNMLLHYSNQS